MKKLLIPTDFSANATHATAYGYALAKQIKADVMLCNAFIVPTEMPQAGVIVWPMEEYDTIIKASADKLKEQKAELQSKYRSGYTPVISLVNEMGTLTNVVDDIVNNHTIDLIIIGTHGNTGLSTILLGNHSKKMINELKKPLLLVPFKANIKPVKKIAYASDFKHPENDLSTIYKLIPFAKKLNAEILLTHVIDETYQSPALKKWVDNMLTDLSNKADYPNIYYRLIKSRGPESGLDWLCEHGQVDVLAMLHYKHSFFDNLLKGSHTQKMADHITIPLLVYAQTNQ
jgi:nucleotide-binding universal stress UspA family protein